MPPARPPATTLQQLCSYGFPVLSATIYQLIETYILSPRVSRHTMDIHPAIALGAVIAGAALLGPIGALIGIPLAAVTLTVINTFSNRHTLLPELATLAPPERLGHGYA